MILAQGAELLHHVTPVTNNVIRISMIFGYAPANCFQPPKTILKTFQKVDQTHKMAEYEFFREKAFQAEHCLKHYVEKIPYTQDKQMLGKELLFDFLYFWILTGFFIGFIVYMNHTFFHSTTESYKVLFF